MISRPTTTQQPPCCTRLKLVPTVSRRDQLGKSNGLVATVKNPQLLTKVLQHRGYVIQDQRGYQVARLRNISGCIVALYVTGLCIALTPDNSSALELLATIWPHTQREGASNESL
jgi:hypothetical protein